MDRIILGVFEISVLFMVLQSCLSRNPFEGKFGCSHGWSSPFVNVQLNFSVSICGFSIPTIASINPLPFRQSVR
ncbi:hypothetical protein L6452_03673 [Arctium lappa]|uniref:Uncharacterized protein n=1 Tax=Arctium lappa TaxID=4217 RepID=A0ACB9FMT5_ARCLA|nr:hypothetical protein L6452_03673 [Arctium lappa]